MKHRDDFPQESTETLGLGTEPKPQDVAGLAIGTILDGSIEEEGQEITSLSLTPLSPENQTFAEKNLFTPEQLKSSLDAYNSVAEHFTDAEQITEGIFRKELLC